MSNNEFLFVPVMHKRVGCLMIFLRWDGCLSGLMQWNEYERRDGTEWQGKHDGLGIGLMCLFCLIAEPGYLISLSYASLLSTSSTPIFTLHVPRLFI